MLLDMLLLVLAAAILVALEYRRRRRQEFDRNRHQDELVCIVTFHDRGVTLPLIDAYYADAGIGVLDLSLNKDGIGESTLFTNTYRLHLPEAVEQSDVVSSLSAIRTVQSVQIRLM